MTEVNKPQVNIGTDYEGQPGMDKMGVGLSRNFLDGDPAHVCLSIIAMAVQPHPERVQRYPQALVTLAAYAGGAAVTLTTQQFRMLERRVIKYKEIVGGVKYFDTRNFEFASYVHDRAVARAREEKLI